MDNTKHKKHPGKYATYCGLRLKNVRHVGLWEHVKCPECLKYKTVQAIYYDKTKDSIEIPVVKVNDVDMSKLRAFFNKKRHKMIESLEDFIKD